VITILAIFAALSIVPLASLPLILIAAEVSAKQSMITFAAFSAPLHKGFGQIAIENTTSSDFLIGLVIASLICGATLGALGLTAIVASQISAFYLVKVSKRNLGGATGDGFGAANEIGRAMALVTSAAMWEALTWMPW